METFPISQDASQFIWGKYPTGNEGNHAHWHHVTVINSKFEHVELSGALVKVTRFDFCS